MIKIINKRQQAVTCGPSISWSPLHRGRLYIYGRKWGISITFLRGWKKVFPSMESCRVIGGSCSCRTMECKRGLDGS